MQKVDQQHRGEEGCSAVWLGPRLKEPCARQTDPAANPLRGCGFGKAKVLNTGADRWWGKEFMETEAVETDEGEEQLAPPNLLCTESRSSPQRTVVTDHKRGF